MLQKKNIPLLNKDFWFTLLCAAVIGYTSFLLYQEISSRLSYSGTTKVGTITFKRNTAQRKYASFAIWELLDKTSPVYNLDTIRTSPDSDAKLILDGDVAIALSEQTLIVINTTPRGFDIEFTGGSISTIASSRLTIRYKNTSIIVEEGTDFTLKEMEDGLVRLMVNDGKATVDNADSITIVESNHTADIGVSNVNVRETVFKKRYPADSSVLVTGKDTKNVRFGWLSDETDTTLVISMSRDFSVPVYNQQSEGTAIDLLPGRYYWKIISGETESDVFAFNVNREKAPQILTPLNEAIVKTLSGNVSFETGWLNSGGADSYTLLVYQSGSTSPLKEISTLNNSTLIDGLPSGTYELRVRPNFSYAAEVSDVVSPPVIVHVETTATLPAPFISSPPEGASISDAIVKTQGIAVFWRGNREYDHYEVALFSDSSRTNAIARETVYGSSTVFRYPLAPGDYYLSLSPFSGSVRGQDALRSISVSGTPGPALRSPADGSSIESGERFRLVWVDPQKAFAYRVEIANDSSFADVVKKINTPLTYTSAAISEPGIYYARASIVGADGSILLAGAASRFSIAGILRTPSFLEQYRYGDVNISSVPKLATGWAPVAGATSYKLDLVRVGQGMREDIVYSAETTYAYGEVASFKELEKGRYYFKLTAIEQRDGLLLNASAPAKHYFDIIKSQEVRFITPSVIYIRVN